MKILAIESSCDETAAAVVEDGRRALSGVVRTQIPLHAVYGGVVPEIASRAHTEAIASVCEKALADANCTMEEIDAVAVTNRPGLVGALLVGVSFAKSLAYRYRLPLYGINHLRGHIAAAYLMDPALKPPFHALILSGGHTFLARVNGYTDFTLIGTTRDDAAGEAFDKVARVLNIPYPGGRELQNMADAYTGEELYPLPSPALKEDPFDFSFSGLKTAVVNLAHNLAQKGETLDGNKLAASFTRTVQEGLKNRLKNVLETEDVETLVFAGGVAANTGLRTALGNFCDEYCIRFLPVDVSLCGDNAAMIGAQAYYEAQNGVPAELTLNAVPRAEVNE
ncbi:MAG: tRNA (adenosine(37)-N6)-threonylcarbamoyltransferase complex transferase subunit TsaD [Clostridia bacterium]|nr:tRNA (adenosine(37)-N6)-threonylcarbamoyltransferase complex transferase subunit TsaD [Clostridia bacterium]